MPAIDILLKAPVAAETFSGDHQALATVADQPQGRSSFGDFMEKALPKNEASDGQNSSAQGQKSTPTKKQNLIAAAKPGNQLETIPSAIGLQIKTQSPKAVLDTVSTVKTPPKKSDDTTDATLAGNLLQPISSPDPLPVFLTLPLSAHLDTSANETVAVKTSPNSKGDSTKTTPLLAVTGNVAGKIISNLQPETLTGSQDVKLDVSNLKPADEPSPTVQIHQRAGQPQAAENASAKDLPDDETAKTGSRPSPTAKLELFSLNAPQPQAVESTSAKNLADHPAETPANPKNSDENFQITSAQPATDQPDEETPKTAGTGVAIDAGAMKNSENTNKFAGSGMKNLPGGKIDPSHTGVSHLTAATARSQSDLSSDLSFSSGGNTSSSTVNEADTLVSVPSLTTNDNVRTAERTSEMVALHAMRLTRADADSMSVVIKPGAGTELSLELRQKNGVIEAQAVLQRGDFQALNQQWPDLQQKLEQRGVKLAPLGGENNFSSGDMGQFSRQQKNQSPEETAQQASAFAEFTLAMNRGGATARLATVANVNANEWWA